MKLAVIGAGYVGLVAGAGFAGTGNEVDLIDVDASKIGRLRRGKIPIYEPGLADMVAYNLGEGRLRFTTDLAAAVASAEVVILAVGTPSTPDGTVDMRAMDAAARQLARSLRGYTVIVTKSTVPVGTHRRISDIVAAATDAEFDYVANPEFLKEGAAVADFLKPDRVILGTTSPKALRVMRHLYAPFMRRSDRLIVMDPASAELTKYACNAMLATRVSFINEMARLCDKTGANIDLVRQGMAADRRIGVDFLYPSLGFGGSCLPKDVRALLSLGRSINHPMRIVEAVDLANQEQREILFKHIQVQFDGKLLNRKFAVWGLAFKAGTDDVRESPSLALIRRIVGAGASVAAHDPQAADTARAVLGDNGIEYLHDMYQALDAADALIVCTEWREYRTPDFGRIKTLLKQPLIFDGRNLYDLDWMAELGLTYVSIGRPIVGGEADEVSPQ